MMERAFEAGTRLKRAEGNGGEGMLRTTEWRNLVADVEDLIKKVANVKDAEIAEIRSRVEHTLAQAKDAASEGVATIRGYARDASRVTDEYVHESPWAAIGIAAAVGVLIGVLSAVTTRR
jgi:ElaB/YqjD/DUF883 family membrane-anchored ribosome-binding protein